MSALVQNLPRSFSAVIDTRSMVSHVNSYPRMELRGMSAFGMLRFVYGEEYVKSANELGLKEFRVGLAVDIYGLNGL